MRRGVREAVGAVVAAAAITAGLPGTADAANTWTVQSVPLPSGATTAEMAGVSCLSATSCEAVMNYGQSEPAAEQWNGSTWTEQALPLLGGVDYQLARSVSCSSATSCMTIGNAATFEDTLSWAARWNGSTWTYSYANFGADALYGVSCPSASRCMAVGSLYVNNSNDVPFAAMWTGRGWKATPVPVPSGTYAGTLNSVSCVTGTDCVAVGESGPFGASSVLAYRWDGTSWTQQTLPAPPGGTNPVLNGVACATATSCAAVGDDTTAGHSGVFAEHWDGSTWTAQDTPVPAGTTVSSLDSVSCARARCTAAGWYYPAGATTYVGRHALAEFFTGTAWRVQATAIPTARKFLSSVSCVAARTCTAVGSIITSRSEAQNQPLAEQE